MNNQSNIEGTQSVEKAYASHVLRYVGVGLISGSIVHMGTLGGGYLKYVVLITMGVIAFVIGTLMEKIVVVHSVASFIVISVILSIGVGMVSGGTQHYLDGPIYAAFLIPIGLAVGYFAFLIRDYKSEVTLKKIVAMVCVATALIGVLYYAAHYIPTLDNHHNV